MTQDDRAALAEQIAKNPLVSIILSELEQSAVDRCINAAMTDHETRSAAAAEVRAIRAFRSKLEASLRDNRPTKGAPA